LKTALGSRFVGLVGCWSDGDHTSLLRPFTVLPVTAEAEVLADEYIGREVFPRAARADALHVAVATIHGVGIIVSWNFRHMVRLRTRQLLAAINPLLGYPVLQIVSPLEV
jgi:hypothetical protein